MTNPTPTTDPSWDGERTTLLDYLFGGTERVSLDDIKQSLSEYLLHNQKSRFQEALFRLHLTNVITPIIKWVVLALILILLATWPTDVWILSDPELLETYFIWRILLIPGLTILLVALDQVTTVQRHAFFVTFFAISIGIMISGYLFGSVREVPSTFFYVLYGLPVATIFYPGKMPCRILSTLFLAAIYPISFIVGGLIQNSPGAYLGYDHYDIIVNLTLLVSSLSVLFGHSIYHLIRANFFETRKLEEQRQTIQRMADRDDLTDLYNHRKIIDQLREELVRANRYDLVFSLLIIDIDNFKQINDRHGHPTGDRVLSRIAEIITEQTRTADMLGRIGGDEFMVILPDTQTMEATNLAERLRQRMAEEEFVNGHGEQFQVTCSIGLTAVSSADTKPKNVIQRADDALYRAKESGRDCIIRLVDES